jgi:hypothetical protein
MEGAAVLKGEHAGDQWLRMTMPELPDVPDLGDMTMVVRDGTMAVSMFGATEKVPLPAGLDASDEALASFATLELARCVETVRVTEDSSLDGEAATRVSGVVDTECVLELVGKLSKMGGAAGQDLDVADLGAEIGDVRATLYVSNRSQLLLGGVFSLDIAMDGEEVSVDVVYRLKSVNEPVRFPEL